MARLELFADAGFTEIADRVWVARRSRSDVNSTLVEGERGLLLVDAVASDAGDGRLLAEVAAVSSAPVLAAVNTHGHLAHVLGNAVVRATWPDALLLAQETAAHDTATAAPPTQDAHAGGPDAGQVQGARLVAADTTFSSVRALDLGDRYVELVHPGRGHTGGDVVVVVPDADVVVAGDLVAEAGPPAYGPDCFPLDWPGSVETLIGMLSARTLVVPGHGDVVDEAFVRDQHHDLAVVAETITAAANRSLGVDAALEGGSWPFPPDQLRHAVERGLAQVPRSERRLPLV